MTAARYPVATLVQMADIPAEALPRFVKELPAILEAMRQIVASAPELGAEMKAAAPWPFRYLPLSLFVNAVKRSGYHAPNWVDDDKGICTLKVVAAKDAEPFYQRAESMKR